MRFTSVVLALMLASGAALASEKAGVSKSSPTLTNENEILLPANYRSWVAVSPATPGMPARAHQHLVSRIYVEPTAYDGFVKKGVWPDHTVIVLELRDKTVCTSRRVVGLEVAAKNEAHVAEPWTYYGIVFDHPKPAAEARMLRPDDPPYAADMRLAMFFPALRAVINANPQAMQPSAF